MLTDAMKEPNNKNMVDQLPLFLEEHVLLNRAVQDMQSLRLAEAKAALTHYRELYPRGECVSARLKLTNYLVDGLTGLPDDGAGAAALCRLWHACADFAASLPFHDAATLATVKQSLFRKAAELLDPQHLSAEPFLPDQIPAGYIYLMAGQFDHAIASLQAALMRTTKNAHIYGYLGDAYTLRGDTVVARICYLEALLIDPDAVDWRSCQDAALLELKKRLQEEQGLNPVEATHWLSSYAYVAGIFPPKPIKQLDTIKTSINEYLRMERDYQREATTAMGAGLFMRAIILCDNEALLRIVKGIDYADIRLRMKTINAPLFAAYMQHMKDRGRPGNR
jgi:tetratricopeptide (TPR) repeat protein